MSALIDNIKRLAGMIRNEKKSGANTAERVGGLIEEIADELNNKYDRTEADRLMNTHNTAEASHLNIQQKLIQLIDETREALLKADQEITQDLTAHAGIKAIHKTSEEIRAEIVDQDIPATLARISYVQAQRTEILNIAQQLVTSGIAEVVGGAPDALNALNELAAAINNDPNFAASIMALINAKADLIHTHTKAQITDFPAAMPASDVYSWAKQPTKPAYSAAEVGASPSNHNHAGVYQPAGSYATGNHTHEGVYQPAGNYAPANHNHAGVYQPAGSYATSNHNHNGTYAPANHNHTADQISDTSTKVIMTKEERSKLAGLELREIQNDYVITDEGIYYYSSGDGSITYNLNNPKPLQTIEIIGNTGDNYTQFGRVIPFYENGSIGFYNEVGFSFAHIIILFKNGIPSLGFGYGEIQNCS